MASIWIILSIFAFGCSYGAIPDDSLCGVQVHQPHVHQSRKRIANGVDANAWSWPWMAILNFDGMLRCGGSLVKTRNGSHVIITAAHCIEGLHNDLTRWEVRLGTYRRSANSEMYRSVYKIRKVLIHKDFLPATYQNDIAVLWLEPEVVLNNGTLPICVTTKMYGIHENCVVLGWGIPHIGGDTVDKLQEAYKPIRPLQECQHILADYSFDPQTMMCAGDLSGTVDACQFDSGGPLACQRNDKWYLTGIVSWGFGCATPDKPGVYTNVFHYVENDWLTLNVDI